jgi:hypothetical protein
MPKAQSSILHDEEATKEAIDRQQEISRYKYKTSISTDPSRLSGLLAHNFPRQQPCQRWFDVK